MHLLLTVIILFQFSLKRMGFYCLYALTHSIVLEFLNTVVTSLFMCPKELQRKKNPYMLLPSLVFSSVLKKRQWSHWSQNHLIPRKLISKSELGDWDFIKCSEFLKKEESKNWLKRKETFCYPLEKKVCVNMQWWKTKYSPLN